MISVIYIVKNGGDLLRQSLNYLSNWADDIVVINNNSSDNTVAIAHRYHARVFYESKHHEGALRKLALSKAKYQWILVLDHDEIITQELKKEIIRIVDRNTPAAYLVCFQNHLFGKPLLHGGETYTKLVFFHRSQVKLLDDSVHARFISKCNTPEVLQHFINHYSYQSIPQIMTKFTDYGIRLAKERYQNNESITMKKLFLYAPHMFWARFIRDQGYKDGPQRILLDGAFAYMEFLSYAGLTYYYLAHAHRTSGSNLPHAKKRN